jgi:hypothetical protein
MVKEHIEWAIRELEKQLTGDPNKKEEGQSRLNQRLIRSVEKGMPKHA